MDSEELVFVGDFFPQREVAAGIPYKRVVLNLEAPLCDGGEPVAGKVNLKGSAAVIASLRQHSDLYVNLGNNHSCDYGDAGFAETISHLTHLSIPYFGAGITSTQAMRPISINCEGMNVALIGLVCPTCSPVYATDASCGVAEFTLDNARQAIEYCRELGADRVVVNIHWGAEEVGQPKTNDILKARSIIDLGADLIIGHHPHCIQPYERYKDKYIFYSLGNCVFDDFSALSNYDPVAKRFNSERLIKQHKWNRRSLAVRYSPRENRVAVDELQYQESRLAIIKRDSSRFLKKLEKLTSHEQRYRVAYFFGKYRAPLIRYIRNPKLLKWHHVRGILSTVFGDQTK